MTLDPPDDPKISLLHRDYHLRLEWKGEKPW